MELLKHSLILFFCFYSFCAHSQEQEIQYERISLCSMLILNKAMEHNDVLDSVFRTIPFPERFNNHDLGVKVISVIEHKEDESEVISAFIKQVNLGQKFIAKWFDRNRQTGAFDMELVKERGFYNATLSDIKSARNSIRGIALLQDAGELLIGNTYLLVNKIEYNSKSTKLSGLSAYFTAFSFSTKAMVQNLTTIGGFKVKVTSYLYRLKWNDEIANNFYESYYTEEPSTDAAKVEAFKNERDMFLLEYIGKTSAESGEQQFTKIKSPKLLLSKVVTRVLDRNIAQLQHEYEPFRIKAPLISTEPLQAYIGLKEDVTSSRMYEVLERVQNEDGSIRYERVGTIRPVPNKIWDNRYMSYEDEGFDADLHATTFEKVSGRDFYTGMLIRELK